MEKKLSKTQIKILENLDRGKEILYNSHSEHCFGANTSSVRTLFKQGYVECSDCLLSLTDKGIEFLKTENRLIIKDCRTCYWEPIWIEREEYPPDGYIRFPFTSGSSSAVRWKEGLCSFLLCKNFPITDRHSRQMIRIGLTEPKDQPATEGLVQGTSRLVIITSCPTWKYKGDW